MTEKRLVAMFPVEFETKDKNLIKGANVILLDQPGNRINVYFMSDNNLKGSKLKLDKPEDYQLVKTNFDVSTYNGKSKVKLTGIEV